MEHTIMTQEEFEKAMQEKSNEQSFATLEANKTRAQSISIGSAGGGTCEIVMRSGSGNFLWNTFQPVEVVELINQLSAGIGCHIQIVPRQDFASFRDWKMSPEELEHARGIQPFQGVGHSPFAKVEHDKWFGNGMAKPKEDLNNVAIEKTIDKSTTEQNADPSS